MYFTTINDQVIPTWAISSTLDRKDILELLLKGCNSVENYAKQCKRMVFEYAPLILTNAEPFLENTDVCNILHACRSPAAGHEQAAAAEAAATVLADA
ncbi:hypothetical protein Q3G72_016464 [Acer saccharum]|nr:hypothetical protein Q3G72_016464 [Acer saccharum]